MFDWVLLQIYFHILNFAPLQLTVLQYTHEIYLKQGLQKLGQTGRRSGLLVSVSLSSAQRNYTKRTSHFLPLSTSIRHYIGNPYSQKDLPP